MENSLESTYAILKKVRRIEIKTNRMVGDALMGSYQSVFKGQGLLFEEVREYIPGDEIRSIDWNVTARMDRPFVKKFREERELTLMLVVDLSASGNFGTTNQSKRELACEVAGTLAFSALRNNDKVGLLLFADEVELYLPPKKGRQHTLRILREILFFKPKTKKTNMAGALQFLHHLLRRKAIIFLLSDFLQNESEELISLNDTKSKESFSLAILNRKHDLICIQLRDKRETTLPECGWVRLFDSETEKQVLINTRNSETREQFMKATQARQSALEKSLSRQSIDYLSLFTGESYAHALQQFFNKRKASRL